MNYLNFVTKIFAVVVFSFLGYKAIDIVKNNNSYISTNGLSDRIVDSDEVVLTVNIRNDADSPKDVSEKRKQEKDVVLNFLKQNGIQDSEIDKTFCDIEENYRYSEEKSTAKKYKIIDKISIKSVRVEDIKKLSGDLSKLIDDGICVFFDIEYYYKDMEKLRIEMIEEAAKDSINRAKHIADIANTQINGIRNFSTGSFSISSADSSSTSNDEWGAQRALQKRVRVVVHGCYNIK